MGPPPKLQLDGVLLLSTTQRKDLNFGDSCTVALVSDHPQWLGADTLDNIAAEFTAYIIAQILAFSGQFHGRIAVRPDLQLSRTIAEQEQVTTSNPKLALLARTLSNWTSSTTSVIEVRGHQDHAWNELADALAKWSIRQSSDPPTELPCLAPFQELVKHPHDLHWAWFQECPRSFCPCFPPLQERQLAFFPPSLRRVLPEMPMPYAHEGSVLDTFDLKLTLVTANVLALDGVDAVTEAGRRTGHRTARLDHQWHEQQVHFIGIQEARTLEGSYQSDHYRILASGGEGPKAARLGCELWCHASLPLAKASMGQALHLKDFDVVVCHTDSRRLIVKFTNQHLAFAVVVLHAPCLGKSQGQGHRPIDDVAHWWATTTTLLQRAALPELQWFLVDANAPLDDSPSQLRGKHGAEPNNATGSLFMDFLDTHQLSVPATFAHLHQGQSYTWTHSSGSHYRRDYVLTSTPAFALVQASWVQTSYDGTFLHEDHLPAAVHCRGLLPSGCKIPRIRWDEDKLRDPECCRRFQEALVTLPLPTWSVATAEHCRIYELTVLQLAQQFFVKPKGKRTGLQ